MRIKKYIPIIITFLLLPSLAWSAIVISQGGTNITSYTVGDMLYASGQLVLSKLAIGTTGQFLTIVGGLPVWGNAVDLTTDQTIAGVKTFSSNILTTAGDCTADNEYCQRSFIESLAIQPSRTPVRAVTTVVLPTSFYNNGVDGMGAFIAGTANGALTAQDGVTLIDGDRLLVKNQVTSTENGIYVVRNIGDVDHQFLLTRATDYDEAVGNEVSDGSYTYPTEGNTSSTFWALVSDDVITIGTSNLTFLEISPQAIYTAGDGIAQNGLVFSVKKVLNDGLQFVSGALTVAYDDSSLGITSNKLAVKPLGITNSMLAGAIDLTTKTSGYSSGQLLIGNDSELLSKGYISAGTDIQVTTSSGGITITNTGNTGAAYTGDGISTSTPVIMIGNNAGLTAERAIAVNAVNLSAIDGGANGSYTIDTIQGISSAASPTFTNLTLTGNSTTTNATTTGKQYVGGNLTVGGSYYGTWAGGIIPVSLGGTGSSTISLGALFYGSSAGVIGGLNAPTIANWVLRSTGANTFAWGALVDADIPDTITASNYLSLINWFATTSAPQLTTLAGLTSIGTAGVNTALLGTMSAGTSTIKNLIVQNVSTSTFAGGLTVGTSQFVVQQSTGNVGIGITIPATALDIVGTASSTGLQVNGNGTITGDLFNLANDGVGISTRFLRGATAGGTSADTLYLQYGSSNNVWIGNSGTAGLIVAGNVGIGTVSPGAKLDVDSLSGTIGARITTRGASDILQLYGGNTPVKLYDFEYDSSGNPDAYMNLYANDGVTSKIRFYAAGDSYFNGGNVGIGTTTPEAKLTIISGNPANPYSGISLLSNASNAYTAITVGRTVPEGYFAQAAAINSYLTGTVAGDNVLMSLGKLHLSGGKAVGGTQAAMTISGDNVGIGTTTPTSNLHIYNNSTALAKIETTALTGTNVALTLQGGSSGNLWYMGTNRGDIAGLATSLFFYNSSAMMVLQANGNVGIGDTTPAALLTVGSGDDFQISATGAVTTVVSDASTGIAIYGKETGAGSPSIGVKGETTAVNTIGYGVQGLATGAGTLNVGVYGNASGAGTNYGVYGLATVEANSYAGYFEGDVVITGSIYSVDNIYSDATTLAIRPNSAGDVSFFGVGNTAKGVTINGFATTTGAMAFKGVAGCTLGIKSAATTGALSCITSDASLKTNIKPMPEATDILMALTPKTYNWKNPQDGTELNYGLMAQDVEKVSPDLVFHFKQDGQDLMGVNWFDITAMLLKSFQDLKIQVDNQFQMMFSWNTNQDTQIKDLQKQVNVLIERLNKLEKPLGAKK